MEPQRKRETDGTRRETGEMMKKKKKVVEEEFDEEVEEFFAILNRIHVAVKYFEKVNGSGRRELTAAVNPWKPSFQLEDFEEVVDQSNSGLDLNSEPANTTKAEVTTASTKRCGE